MAEEETPPLYRRIRALAQRLRMSDEAVSRKAGLERNFVRNIKRGKSGSPGIDNMRAIAAALDSDLDELLQDQPPEREGVAERELLRIYGRVPADRRADFLDAARLIARLVAEARGAGVEVVEDQPRRRAKGGGR